MAPDLDVVYNALCRGFFNHSTLWTHSLFVYLGIGLGWAALRRSRRGPYVTALTGLIAAGGLSHLLLDALSHGTPLFYPLSLYMVGAPPVRVLEGGVRAYLTDPIFLGEPLLLAIAAGHGVHASGLSPQRKRLALAGLAVAWLLCTVAFLRLLPELQRLAAIGV